MTQNLITPSLVVSRQVPRFVATNNPLFIKFFEYYYQYLESIRIQEIIQEIRKFADIDSTDEAFLLNFFEELKLLPQKIASDNRLVAKHIFDLYKSKGSEQAIKLLFRIVYGEEIDIKYPRENMLVTSSGNWHQEYVLTTQKLQGNIESTSNRMVFENIHGQFDYTISRLENNIETNKCRFFIEPKSRFYLLENQEITVLTNDVVDYVGKLIKTNPTQLKIVDSGKFWQVGQVFRIPGTIRDTICKVKSVTTGGSLKYVDIIQHGYGHLKNQNIVLSPFKYKPKISYTELIKQVNSDGGIDYTLKIHDFIKSISENIIGTSWDQRYVLEGYVLRGYINRLAVKNSTMFIDSNDSYENNEITHQQWLDSLTRIELVDGLYGKCPGFYSDNMGHLSDEYIKIQDSKFYQLFCYVIKTQQSISEYKNVHSLFHPAGIKYFSDMTLSDELELSATTERIISTDAIYLGDYVDTKSTISFV